MKNITINTENLTEEEIKTLTEILENSNKLKNKKPNYGDVYFYIQEGGFVENLRWLDDNTDYSIYRFKNCFRTEKEAELELEKRKTYNELMSYAEEHNRREIDWNDTNQQKWCIYYSEGKLQFAGTYKIHYMGQVYFTGSQTAKDAVKAIGEDKIKKYLFGGSQV